MPSVVRPTLTSCTPSGPALHFPGQCELEMEWIRQIQAIPVPLDHVSELLHPKYAIILGIACACYVGGRESYLQYYVVASWLLCDASHFLLKWMFQGDRPYWVQGNSFKQFSHTCEAGYGFPSGHSCVLSSILGAFYWHCIRKYAPGKKYSYLLVLVVCEVAMMISRSYTGSHFVSQTVAGAFYGVLWVPLSKSFGDFIVHVAKARRSKSLSFLKNAFYSLVFLAIPAAFYGLQWFFKDFVSAEALQTDVYRSIKLADAGCTDPSAVRKGTVYQGPLYETVGVALFLAFSLGNTTLRAREDSSGSGAGEGEGKQKGSKSGFASEPTGGEAAADAGEESSTTEAPGASFVKRRARNATPAGRGESTPEGAKRTSKGGSGSSPARTSTSKKDGSPSPKKTAARKSMSPGAGDKKRKSGAGATADADAPKGGSGSPAMKGTDAPGASTPKSPGSAMKSKAEEQGATSMKKASAGSSTKVRELELSPTELIFQNLDEVKLVSPVLCKVLIYMVLLIAVRRVLEYLTLPDMWRRLLFGFFALRCV